MISSGAAVFVKPEHSSSNMDQQPCLNLAAYFFTIESNDKESPKVELECRSFFISECVKPFKMENFMIAQQFI